jgi:uncharacterized protein YheU (UPF0270 family)
MAGPAEDLLMEQQPSEPIVVPHTELAADLLRAVIESFVLREGTDYGEKEYSLDEKVARVTRQLERGEAQIVFDPDTESVDIAVRRGARTPR